jgi:hypothetical protein
MFTIKIAKIEIIGNNVNIDVTFNPEQGCGHGYSFQFSEEEYLKLDRAALKRICLFKYNESKEKAKRINKIRNHLPLYQQL